MKIIQPIPIDFMYAQFLSAEWYKSYYNQDRTTYDEIVRQGDLSDQAQNATRLELLWKKKYPIIADLPANTTWYLASISPVEFGNFFVINEHTWHDTFGKGKRVKEVADLILQDVEPKGVDIIKIKEIQQNIGAHDFSEKLITISDKVDNHHTVLEGNHRAIAFHLHYVLTQSIGHYPATVIIGLSKDMPAVQWYTDGNI